MIMILRYVPVHRRAVASGVILFIILITYYGLRHQARACRGIDCLPASPFTAEQDGPVSQREEALSLPAEYSSVPEQPSFCADRFGHQYLEKLVNSSTGYCKAGSSSSLTCFHSQTASDSRTDSFCIGTNAAFSVTGQKFKLACERRTLTGEDASRNVPEIDQLRSYWYNTGPGHIFKTYIDIDPNLNAINNTSSFTVLLKREGAGNLWHSLMEIFSLTMTFDVLRMTRDPTTNVPFFTIEDAENTQILILDDHEDGPYFDLWTLFAHKPIIRLHDMTESPTLGNIIVPLPGGSNPTWQGDWEAHPCDRSDLMLTFSQRVLRFYGLDHQEPRSGPLVVTYIDRRQTRRLVDQKALLEEIGQVIPHIQLQSIDFAAISFKEQLRVIHGTDVLLGVHGAGMTHGMFLREGSAMVEILPAELNHKGFRNLAGMLGLGYFSTHVQKAPLVRRGDWHNEDIFLEKSRFVNLVEVAVKSIYNKGLRNYDVN